MPKFKVVICASCKMVMKENSTWIVYGAPTESDIAEGWPVGIDMGSCPECFKKSLREHVSF